MMTKGKYKVIPSGFSCDRCSAISCTAYFYDHETQNVCLKCFEYLRAGEIILKEKDEQHAITMY